MVSFEEARAIVRSEFAWTDAPYVVAEFGAENDTQWRVIHGHPDDVAGTADPPAVLNGPTALVTLVDKATGAVSFLNEADPATWDAIDALRPFGPWPG